MQPPSWLPPEEFARQARDLLEQRLTAPQVIHDQSGSNRHRPPVDSRFHLDQVRLRTTTEPAEIQILFHWTGQTTLFGLSYQIDQEDDEEPPGVITPAEFAITIELAIEEDLLAMGYGIENADREPEDDVTWLHWKTPGTR